MIDRIFRAWAACVVVLFLLSFADGPIYGTRALTNLFFRTQDIPVVIVATLLWAGIALVFALAWKRIPTLPVAVFRVRPALTAGLLAGACFLIAWVGAYVVYDNYALSMDEYMANFDADILAHGHLMGQVPPNWRPLFFAIHPEFVLGPAGHAVWASSYLPINAALRAAAGVLSMRALVNPLLAAVSVFATFGIGRRLWPEQPKTALIAAILLASSSQLLGTAMTAYAMTAHLAFNLVWLWLFLRGGGLDHDARGLQQPTGVQVIDSKSEEQDLGEKPVPALSHPALCHAGAILVGALACGLHQLIFHPLFVAPFILQLWLDRRFALAGLYTAAYAGIGLFWMDYDNIALASMHLGHITPDRATAEQGGRFGTTLVNLLRAFDLNAIGLMAKNLIRFATWQNLLVAPLCVLGVVPAWRERGTMRCLLGGMILTLAAVFVLMPYQGHGWGYRYLHGLLGSACLIAAWTWTKMTQTAPEAERASNAGFLAAATAASVLILFPARAWQMHAFVHPYAMADAYIRGLGADVVILDNSGQWFTLDLLRTDTFAARRPLVLLSRALTAGQLRDLCARHTISFFDQVDAKRFGIRTFKMPASIVTADPRSVLRSQKCGISTQTTGAQL